MGRIWRVGRLAEGSAAWPRTRSAFCYPLVIDAQRVQRIHQQLAEIRQRGIQAFGAERHGFRLGSPVPPHELEAFETGHSVRLPEHYRDFLLYVGNGGAGQAYGLYPLDKTGTGGTLCLPSPLHPDMPAQGDWHDVLGLHEDSDAPYDGALTLLTQGCTYDVLLIVTGPERGRVVYVDWNMEQAPWFSFFPDFLTWYETWLRETLAGYDMTWFGYGLPLDEAGSTAVAVQSEQPQQRRMAAFNTLSRAPRLEPHLLVRLHTALGHATDPAIATPLIGILADKGERVDEALIWTWLRQAHGRQVVHLIAAMKTMGLATWIQAAEWALVQDEDQDTSQGLLFMLKREGALTPHAVRLGFASHHVTSTALYVNHELSQPVPVPAAFFTHPDPATRRSAVEYQSVEALQPHLGLLLRLLGQEQSDHVRQGWVLKLGQCAEPEVRQALASMLKTETSPRVLSALVRVIERNKIAEAVPTLIELTRSEDEVLRLEAANALGQLGDQRARPALKALFDQDVEPMRREGGGGVGYSYSIATAARKALKTLRTSRWQPLKRLFRQRTDSDH